MRTLSLSSMLLLVTSTLWANEPANRRLTLGWADNMLTVRGAHLPGSEVQIWYIEAYCRPESTDRDWNDTVIGHRTELVAVSADGQSLQLRCTLNDGVVVSHDIRAVPDGVEFRLTASNPTERVSEAHWAQPCIRVDKFTGCDQETYLGKSFVFIDGQLERLPTPRWATQARYTPGQVWRPANVDRRDVNPRPLNDVVPSCGLIGCFSSDEKLILATAWEPYQELFQGVIVCLHSDFRIGGLQPGQTKQMRGKLYLVDADVEALLARYEQDFPEQQERPR